MGIFTKPCLPMKVLFLIATSVPQRPTVLIFTSASEGFGSGMGTSMITNLFASSTFTAAFMSV